MASEATSTEGNDHRSSDPNTAIDSAKITRDESGTNEKSAVASAAATTSARDVLKSPGVRRVEALSSVLTTKDRIFIFFGVFLVAYAYGLDGTLRYAYQPYASGSFNSHSLNATLNVIKAVIGAATQPTAGKVADVFGRVELILASVFFYVLGTVLEASATNLPMFAIGTAIYQVGYTIVVLLVEVIVADFTSTRARLFFSYIPATPFIINTWVSGNITSAVMGVADWRWGYGMWCIIYPVCTLPLIISLLVVSRRAKNAGLLTDYKSSFELLGLSRFSVELFWLLDIIGVFLIAAMFALILVPLTLAGGLQDELDTSGWSRASTIAPIVFGVLCIPVFIFWELKAPHPLVPFKLMKDRSVWAPIIIAINFNFAWTMQGDYLYTVLIVAFNFNIADATRITSLYSFVSVIVGPLLGLVVYKVRRLKYFIVVGTALYMTAFGLLIHFRGSGTSAANAKAGVIAAQVVLGIAGGMFPYPTQASLQVYLRHENLAVMTGLYLAMYNIGSALGNAVSGAIWTQTMPRYLRNALPGYDDVVTAVYQDPVTNAILYPIGSPERDGIITAYRHTQRLLTITGICLCVPLIGLALALRNPKLTDEQSLTKEADSESEHTQEQPLSDRVA